MSPYSNIIYNNNIPYKIIDTITIDHFLNSDNTINRHVLGMYVHEKGADHVLQRDNQLLICETIEDAQIIE